MQITSVCGYAEIHRRLSTGISTAIPGTFESDMATIFKLMQSTHFGHSNFLLSNSNFSLYNSDLESAISDL